MLFSGQGSRKDKMSDRFDVFGVPLDHSFDSSAVFMSENNNQTRVEIENRIFDTVEFQWSDNIAGDSDNKEIANPLIKNNLRSHSRIRTA